MKRTPMVFLACVIAIGIFVQNLQANAVYVTTTGAGLKDVAQRVFQDEGMGDSAEFGIAFVGMPKQNIEMTNSKRNRMEHTEEAKEIEKLLFSYRDALSTSDVKKVLPLYADDGVFMPSNAPSAIGKEQVSKSYDSIFKTIQLNIEFTIDEIVVDGGFAFARTTSKGTTLIRENGQVVPEENRELFVIAKTNGQWKIARYMFNKMK